MIRGAVAAAALVLALPVLTGCGRGTSYCGTVRSHQAELGTIIQSGGRGALLQALPIFEALQGAAPSDVADDWQLLVTRITALRTALTDAHVDPTTYDPRHPPSGVTSAQRTAILRAAAGVGAADSRQALADLQQEVLDVCHTPLEL
ncbi:hypothetical protein [Nocardioides cynanchi]|uniref:hypothetical protein n=1 Tax=Nocardioides cynanchi TaxID=2558918 RepID=UPI0012445C57|nr:hypothetical protein [Nocardioides cynanchi]